MTYEIIYNDHSSDIFNTIHDLLNFAITNSQNPVINENIQNIIQVQPDASPVIAFDLSEFVTPTGKLKKFWKNVK